MTSPPNEPRGGAEATKPPTKRAWALEYQNRLQRRCTLNATNGQRPIGPTGESRAR